MLQIFNKFALFSSSLIRIRVFFTAFALLVCFAAAQNASAATFTVTRSDDRNLTCNSGVDCSLREAVKAANAAATGDVINFAAGLTNITLASGNDGDIKIINPAGSLLINGPGANILTIDGGAGTNRIFQMISATVTIYGVTMQGGNGNSGSSSSTDGYGGAIATSSSSLTLNTVVLQNNGGVTIGGGALSFFDGAHHIVNSTISGNQSKSCGGLVFSTSDNGNPDNNMSIVNSTISGNSAAGDGGVAGAGLCNEGTMSIRNSTLTNNTATGGDGGGIVNFSTINIGNTIIAGNISASNPEIRNNGTITSNGNNLVGDSAGDSTNTQSVITYQASDIRDTPPLLGVLQNNGGATPTHALLAGSPGIDKGSNALLIDPFTNSPILIDQRGLQRVVDGNGDGTQTTDIGAFEAQVAPTAATVTASGRVVTNKGNGIANVRVTLTGTDGETRAIVSGADGYFQFTDVQAGETYIFSVAAKHYTFSQPVQVFSIVDDTSAVNFIADGAKRILTP
jgi:CSLREA domain-containing protein